MSWTSQIKELERRINRKAPDQAELAQLKVLLKRFKGKGVMLPLSRRRASRLNMVVYEDPCLGYAGAPYELENEELDWIGVVVDVGVEMDGRRPRSYLVFNDPEGYVRVYFMYVSTHICIYPPDAWDKLLVAIARGATFGPKLMRSIGLERV